MNWATTVVVAGAVALGVLWFDKNVQCENVFKKFCTITTGNSVTVLQK